MHPHALVHVGRTWMVGAEGPTTTDGAIQLVTVPVVVEAVMAHRVASTRTARALPAIRRCQVWFYVGYPLVSVSLKSAVSPITTR